VLVGDLVRYSEFARKADAIIGTDLLNLSNLILGVGYGSFASRQSTEAEPPRRKISLAKSASVYKSSPPGRKASYSADGQVRDVPAVQVGNPTGDLGSTVNNKISTRIGCCALLAICRSGQA